MQRLTPVKLRTATVVAIAVLASAWFFLGSAGVSAAINRGTLSPTGLALFGAIVAANFAALILAAVAAYRQPGRWGDVFVVVVLALNVIGSVLDQVGLWDVAYLVMSASALGLASFTWRSRRRAHAGT